MILKKLIRMLLYFFNRQRSLLKVYPRLLKRSFQKKTVKKSKSKLKLLEVLWRLSDVNLFKYAWRLSDVNLFKYAKQTFNWPK